MSLNSISSLKITISRKNIQIITFKLKFSYNLLLSKNIGTYLV